jgi:tRNA G10  N-methylase Trm11
LDPFCGCGTTVAAAEKLGRSWIGVDVTYLAIALIEQRLQDHHPGIEYKEHGSPKDVSGAKALFEGSHKNFEMWVCVQFTCLGSRSVRLRESRLDHEVPSETVNVPFIPAS